MQLPWFLNFSNDREQNFKFSIMHIHHVILITPWKPLDLRFIFCGGGWSGSGGRGRSYCLIGIINSHIGMFVIKVSITHHAKRQAVLMLVTYCSTACRMLFILLCLLPTICYAHVALTFPQARYPPLDFLDTARTSAPCGVPRPPTRKHIFSFSNFEIFRQKRSSPSLVH